MLRFLKKRFKHSQKLVPPENLTHQITGTSAECGRVPDGEDRLGKISESMGLVGLIRPSRQIPTTERVLKSLIRTGGVGINSFPRRIPQL